MSKRIGPCMSVVSNFVSANPGCVMIRAARYVGPRGSLRYGYASVHRAIRAGLVRKERGERGCWLLYPAA